MKSAIIVLLTTKFSLLKQNSFGTCRIIYAKIGFPFFASSQSKLPIRKLQNLLWKWNSYLLSISFSSVNINFFFLPKYNNSLTLQRTLAIGSSSGYFRVLFIQKLYSFSFCQLPFDTFGWKTVFLILITNRRILWIHISDDHHLYRHHNSTVSLDSSFGQYCYSNGGASVLSYSGDRYVPFAALVVVGRSTAAATPFPILTDPYDMILMVILYALHWTSSSWPEPKAHKDLDRWARRVRCVIWTINNFSGVVK